MYVVHRKVHVRVSMKATQAHFIMIKLILSVCLGKKRPAHNSPKGFIKKARQLVFAADESITAYRHGRQGTTAPDRAELHADE